jgi:hypothetical protein
MSCTSKTTSLGSPVVQNLARDKEPIINTTDTRKQRNSASNHRNSNSQHQRRSLVTTHHAWPLVEPCRTDDDMAVALPATLRQATIRNEKEMASATSTSLPRS